ncbi:MAG: hypothetical protein K2M79_00970 [Muribaculaceae bacterium]|nr:hypothetical protein [Muribaculaceae bacterium]
MTDNSNAEIKRVRKLLERYYEATVTPEEMDVLRDYFASVMEIPDDMQVEALIFTAEFPAPHPEQFFDASFLDRIESEVRCEQEQNYRAGGVPYKRKKLVLWMTSAATVAAAIALVFLLRHAPVMNPTVTQEIPAPQTVLAQASAVTVPDTVVVARKTVEQKTKVPSVKPARRYKETSADISDARADSIAAATIEKAMLKLDRNIDRMQAALDENSVKVSRYISTFDDALDGNCDINSVLL